MVAGGLPERSQNHCERVAAFALEMQATMRDGDLRTNTGERVQPASASTQARRWRVLSAMSKFAYDLWGDTVNTASRMESQWRGGKDSCFGGGVWSAEGKIYILKSVARWRLRQRHDADMVLVTTQPSQ